MKEQICVRYPQSPHMSLEINRTPLVIDVPKRYSGISLAQEGVYLNEDFAFDVAANTKWFIPPSQVLWVKRIND